jgi:hypothetical protein
MPPTNAIMTMATTTITITNIITTISTTTMDMDMTITTMTTTQQPRGHFSQGHSCHTQRHIPSCMRS